jgi:hypothetical protein
MTPPTVRACTTTASSRSITISSQPRQHFTFLFLLSTMPRGSASPTRDDPWAASHIAPTIADVQLAPRRKLRDGSDCVSSSTARRIGASGSSSRAPTGTSLLGKRGRSDPPRSSRSHTRSTRSGFSNTPEHDDTPTPPIPATASSTLHNSNITNSISNSHSTSVTEQSGSATRSTSSMSRLTAAEPAATFLGLIARTTMTRPTTATVHSQTQGNPQTQV